MARVGTVVAWAPQLPDRIEESLVRSAGSMLSQHTRAVQTKQAAAGHDAANNRDGAVQAEAHPRTIAPTDCVCNGHRPAVRYAALSRQRALSVRVRAGRPGPRWRSAGATDTGSAFEGVAFFRGQPAPDSGVLAGLHGPFQAGLSDFASSADGLGFFYLEKRSTGVPVGEEQFGVHAQACSAVAPGHHGRDP